ncbi:hypothetical protein ES705_37111 [subsurface metagenome]
MDENKDSKYCIKELREKTRSYAESGVIIQCISKSFAENQDNIYNINEIFEIAISPFHSIDLNDFSIILVVKVICNFWVDEGKLNLIEINGEYFYHARNYTEKRKFPKKK